MSNAVGHAGDRLVFSIINDEETVSINKSLVVLSDLSWYAEVKGHKLTPSSVEALSEMPAHTAKIEGLF